MKKALLFAVLIACLTACGSTKRLPAAPEIGTYYDSTWVKLNQEAQFNQAAKSSGKNLTKKQVAFVGISMFTIYCIFAWRSDVE